MSELHKPLIETSINSLAVLFTGFAASIIATEGFGWSSIGKAMLVVIFGIGLEFFKYWGRQRKLW